MNKKQAMGFLHELEGRGIKLGLERMRSFLDFIGNPEKTFKSVHVAGTNGKGSTCAMIESILREAGYKTGLYTSPHLVSFNERIQVGGKQITNEQLAALISELKHKMEESKIELTYFEFITVLAFKHFADSNLDIAIVEVGLGGRLDATNLITPTVSVITNVEKEHEEFLGKTVEAIASEKAGIIKERVPLVTAEWKSDILWLFRQQCMKKGSDMLIVDKPFEGDLRVQVSFQRWNAATAIGVIRELREQGFHVKEKAIERGLLKAHWPCRFDLMQHNPDVILDCCHNPGGCFVLAKAFEEIFPEENPQQQLQRLLSENPDLAQMIMGEAERMDLLAAAQADALERDQERQDLKATTEADKTHAETKKIEAERILTLEKAETEDLNNSISTYTAAGQLDAQELQNKQALQTLNQPQEIQNGNNATGSKRLG